MSSSVIVLWLLLPLVLYNQNQDRIELTSNTTLHDDVTRHISTILLPLPLNTTPEQNTKADDMDDISFVLHFNETSLIGIHKSVVKPSSLPNNRSHFRFRRYLMRCRLWSGSSHHSHSTELQLFTKLFSDFLCC